MLMFYYLVATSVYSNCLMLKGFFEKVETCQNTTSIIVDTVSGISLIKCATLCLRSDECRSFTVELTSPNTCFLNKDFLTGTGCSPVDIKHYSEKRATYNPCLNGGINNNTNGTCRCFHGYIGNYCERLMEDCSEGYYSGHYTGYRMVLNAHPRTSLQPFQVWCEMDYGGRTYILKHYSWNPYMDFNRTWNEYKNGFGDMSSGGNFWLGNERLFYVTNHRPMTLFLQIYTDQDTNYMNYKQHLYWNFTISNELSGFKCSYSTAYPNEFESGIHTLGNCLESQKTMQFTTIDVDNDMGDGNCAATHLSGWWYSDCGGCNPTGKLQPISDSYQNSNPIYVQVPVNNDWAPRGVEIFLEYS